MSRFVTPIMLIAALALGACAERWDKPGATQAEFEATRTDCTARSYARLPARPRDLQITTGYSVPPAEICLASGPVQNCVQQQGEALPPISVIVDANERLRSQDIRACLADKGWRLTD